MRDRGFTWLGYSFHMLPHPLFAAVFACIACLSPSASGAATTDASAAQAPSPAAASVAVTIVDADPTLPRVRTALDQAERGPFDAAPYADLAAHPLYPWLGYADLRRQLDTLDAARAREFLARHRGQAAGEAFRELWVAQAWRRKDWASLLAAWTPALARNNELRCAWLEARHATGETGPAWIEQAQALWRGAGRALPGTCEGVFAALQAGGHLTPALRWERIDKAAAERQPAVMRNAARDLPSAETALASDYAAFLEAVHPRALNWPRTERSRRIASLGLARLAASDPKAAEEKLPQYAQALGFTEAERGRVLYQVALWSASSYEPEAARRLAAVPAAAYDERLHEWRAREAMARSDWRGALAAIRAMGEKQRNDSRWQYFEARLAERTGDKATAQHLYREAAAKAEFHGFLAADRIQAAYPLCPWLPTEDTDRALVERDPAIVRAMGLYRIGRKGWATREWNEALARFSDAQRRVAVEVAQSHGWFDRAVFALGKQSSDELRLYTLRFPLHHDAAIRREAANNRLDPAWVAAQIRAESVFDPRARSQANAMGLMQLLSSTASTLARKLGLPWRGEESLYDSDTNIALGTAYLRQLLDRYGGQPYHAIAGYNAGPTPLERWQSQRPGMDPDFWIETITYKETRDYVARVLAFSVLYDWRLNGNALSLEDRMRGRLDGRRNKFACPLPASPAIAASSQR